MTDTDRTDVGELVRRLRPGIITVDDIREAADRLTALEAENKRLRDAETDALIAVRKLAAALAEALEVVRGLMFHIPSWHDDDDKHERVQSAKERARALLSKHGGSNTGAMPVPRNEETMLQLAAVMEDRALRAEAKLARLRDPDEALVEAVGKGQVLLGRQLVFDARAALSALATALEAEQPAPAPTRDTTEE